VGEARKLRRVVSYDEQVMLDRSDECHRRRVEFLWFVGWPIGIVRSFACCSALLSLCNLGTAIRP
jgi:hypothetical protein